MGVDVGIQAEPSIPDRPKLRIKEKISTDGIKSTCAIFLSTCRVLVEMLQKIVQVVCKELSRCLHVSCQSTCWRKCWNNTRIVHVPSAATVIADHKQILAFEIELEAAKVLYKKTKISKQLFTLIPQAPVVLMVSGHLLSYVFK